MKHKSVTTYPTFGNDLAESPHYFSPLQQQSQKLLPMQQTAEAHIANAQQPIF